MYRQPAVRLTQRTNPNYVAGTTPSLVPLIIGSGALKFRKVLPIKRGLDIGDTLPSDVVNKINTIGDHNGGDDYSATTDFTLSGNVIKWEKVIVTGTATAGAASTITLGTGASSSDNAYKDKTIRITSGKGAGQSAVISGYVGTTKVATVSVTWGTQPDSTSVYEIVSLPVNQPAQGGVYYVDYEAGPESDQYEPRLVTSVDEITDFYGPELKEDDGLICPVVLGAKIALENRAQVVCVLQVAKAGSDIASTDYETALQNYMVNVPYVYRIVPMDLNNDVNDAVMDYVRTMSDPEEMMETRAVFCSEDDSETFADVNEAVGTYAAGYAEKRLNVLYPDVATRKLSDGNVYELSSPYLCAAFAGKEASQPIERAMTKSTLEGFITLKGVRMTRAQKDLLASNGVVILEQASANSAIEIRHGLTTDMSSVQARENSIITIADYTSKYIRSVLKPYIGKQNVTQETLARMRASVNSAFNILVKTGILVAGHIAQIYQDTDNPDTIVVKLSIDVPYPCNYIDIDLFVN